MRKWCHSIKVWYIQLMWWCSLIFVLIGLICCFWGFRVLSIDHCPPRCNLGVLLKHLPPNPCDFGILSGNAYDPPALLVPKTTLGTGVCKVSMEEPECVRAIFGITFFTLILQLVQDSLKAKASSMYIGEFCPEFVFWSQPFFFFADKLINQLVLTTNRSCHHT